MDPVYAGTIAGMTILFTLVVCGTGIYIYKECQLREGEYTRV
jgi:hypothetical protein